MQEYSSSSQSHTAQSSDQSLNDDQKFARITQEDEDLAIALSMQDNLSSSQAPSDLSSKDYAAALWKEQDARSQYLDTQAARINDLFNNPTNTTAPQYTVLGNTGQTAATCGSYAVINAKAIQNLFDKNQPINTDSLRNEAAQYKKLCLIEDAAFDELTSLINELNITIFSVDTQQNNLNFFQDNQGFFITNGLMTNDQNEPIATIFFDFINNIKAKKDAIGHFVINTDDHWIVVSVVQYKDKNPHIYYADTINPNGNPISTNNIGYLFIKSIWGMLK
jgi:hypothetical protein